MGNVFTHKSQKPSNKTSVTKPDVSLPVETRMKTLQLNDSVAELENLPFQIFCYKQFIKSGNKHTAARLYQSKLALTEGIIKTHNSVEDPDDSFLDVELGKLEVSRMEDHENEKLSEYRKKLIVSLREIEKSKRKKRKDAKRLMSKIGKTTRNSVKIIVGKRKDIKK